MAKNSGDDLVKYLIESNNVGFTYTIRHGASRALKETAIRFIKRQSQDVQVQALKNVSFTLEKGEVLAVIGGNGAGKSTLLKLLAKVIPPTEGRVRVAGTVAPMIELGAGFNEELTGRENVVLYGTLLGRSSREMGYRADDIGAWAQIESSLDLPLRTYSSGMIAKLAFSIATDVQSDVILIDEVLSVGDADFQARSKNRIKTLFANNSAVVLVSHDLNAVRDLATKAMWLDQGQIKDYGDVNSVIKAYLNA